MQAQLYLLATLSAGALLLSLWALLQLRQQHRPLQRDSLSGLPSRIGFVERCERELSHGWNPEAVLVTLDVRHLSDINEYYGFGTGDALLRAIGERLQQQTCSGAIAARTGGDEFAVYLPNPGECPPDEPHTCIMRTFEHPFRIAHAELNIQADYGYTRLHSRQRPVDTLLREADLALAHCRAQRLPQHWAAYAPVLESHNRQRIETTHALRQALERGEFCLHFQPKVDLRTGHPVAAEALIRWQHPERGLQAPDTFISIAEQSGLIVPIGEWVIEEACRQLAAWQHEGLDIVRISVNVSMMQFIGIDLAARVSELLALHCVAPQSLVLEITESVFGRERARLLRQLRALSKLGVGLALDDFGTGYSSLAYLQEYPFNEIKIDQTFVRRMLDDRYSRQIVTTIIGLARVLGAEVVAEGIEEPMMRDMLLDMGCHVGQGYFYSMPLIDEDFRWLLLQHPVLPLGLAEGGPILSQLNPGTE